MKLKHNALLKDYTSLHAGGVAKNLIVLETDDDLKKIVSESEGSVWILGFGTNVLVSDKGLPGTVILNQSGDMEVLANNQIRAGSGANWDELIQKAIESSLWGLEFTSGIPGGVGAAVAGNIAAYGHKVADAFEEASILDKNDGSITIWDKAKLKFDYRSSALQLPDNNHLVILDATFQLSNQQNSELEYESALKVGRELVVTPDSLANRRRIIMETRRRAGSLLVNSSVGPWTAGSFFKNPLISEDQVQAIIGHEESAVARQQLLRQNVIHGGDKARVSAAHVLLAAGFSRGQKWGQVRLHPEHILKIENLGEAKAQEIYDVVQQIVATVKQNLGITLEPEVRFLGDFS